MKRELLGKFSIRQAEKPANKPLKNNNIQTIPVLVLKMLQFCKNYPELFSDSIINHPVLHKKYK